jgi:hypothetical protein
MEEITYIVKIMLLHLNTPSYTHPTRSDILQVPRQNVLLKVELRNGTDQTYTFRTEEKDKIINKHSVINRYGYCSTT